MLCKYNGAEFPGTGIPGGTGKISANITRSGRPSGAHSSLLCLFLGPVSACQGSWLCCPLWTVSPALCPQNLASSLANSRASIISVFQLFIPPPQWLARGDFPQQTTVTGTESDCLSAWDRVSAGRLRVLGLSGSALTLVPLCCLCAFQLVHGLQGEAAGADAASVASLL